MEATTSRGAPSHDAYLRRRRFSRSCALQFLYQLDLGSGQETLEKLLSEFWEQLEESEVEHEGIGLEEARPFAERLVRGVLDHRGEIDLCLEGCVKNWTLARMGVVDRNLLRLAAYELLFCDDVPSLVSIDEAVELAKRFGDRDSARFVNGVLDRLRRDREGVEPEAEQE
jgi:N utilization substance protein B